MASVSKLRWGAKAPEDSAAARERLVDAAEECFSKFGVIKTTVEDVASVAQVSRATVYRYFAGRDDLILAVLMREVGRFIADLQALVVEQSDLATAIVEGVIYTVRAVQGDPNLALLFTGEAAGMTINVAGTSEALFRANAQFLHPILGQASESGQLREDVSLDDAAEWILRVILSVLSVTGPTSRDDDSLRRLLDQFLVPALVATPANEPPVATDVERKRRLPGRFGRKL